jgi:hypothetical protein
VIFSIRRERSDSRVSFLSKSGELSVDRDGDLYALDFPARAPAECAVDPGLFDALSAKPKLVLGARDYLCVFETVKFALWRPIWTNSRRLIASRSLSPRRAAIAILSPAFSRRPKAFPKIRLRDRRTAR